MAEGECPRKDKLGRGTTSPGLDLRLCWSRYGCCPWDGCDAEARAGQAEKNSNLLEHRQAEAGGQEGVGTAVMQGLQHVMFASGGPRKTNLRKSGCH